MKSLRWRFLLPYLGILAAVLIGLTLFLPAALRDFTLELRGSNLLAEARLVALQSQDALTEDKTTAQSSALLREHSQLLNARVTLIRPNGTVAGDSSADPAEMDNHADRPEVRSALDGQESTQVRASSTLGPEMLYAAVPVRSGGQVIGCVRLAVTLAEVQTNLANIRRATIRFTLLAILAAMAVTILLTEYTIRPLRRLTDAARKIGGGTFPQISDHGHYDEVSVLEQTFNQMSAQLNAKIHELEIEHEKLNSVLANMTDGILILDMENKVRLINPAAAAILRIEGEKVEDRTLIEAARQHQLVELLARTRQDGKQHATTLETNQGRAFIQAIASPLGGQPSGSVLIMLQDFTRLRQLETVRRDFVSNVSHELRTPLAALKALAETLEQGAINDPPAAQRFLQRMDHEIDTLIQLVQELLELARIESGRVPLVKETITPLELTNEAVERMRLQAERAGVTLSLELPDGLPAVLADRSRMEQVMVNLLHNAIKFTHTGGNIHVSAKKDGDRVIFAIRDTGVGIQPDDLTRIFERFYKTDPARSGGGTGLGLSIARHLVEAHNGRIWAESQPGMGSTFFFSIPVAM